MGTMNIWIRNPEVTGAHIKSLRKGQVLIFGLAVAGIVYYRWRIRALESRLRSIEEKLKED